MAMPKALEKTYRGWFRTLTPEQGRELRRVGRAHLSISDRRVVCETDRLAAGGLPLERHFKDGGAYVKPEYVRPGCLYHDA